MIQFPAALVVVYATVALPLTGCGDDLSATEDGTTGEGGPDEGGPDADADAGRCVPGCDGGPCTPGGWATICPGTFLIGSPASEPGRSPYRETQHLVTLTRPFEISSAEVTQAQFQDRMGYNPSYFTACGADCPVEMVNWHEAAAYCNSLSAAAGLALCYACSGTDLDTVCDDDTSHPSPHDCPGYRLPTEAEWEYAARAGTTGGTYGGTCDDAHLGCEQPNPVLDPIAWFCGNSGYAVHAVATRDANSWGLYDMLGNVGEWCSDWWDGIADYAVGTATDPWGLTSGSMRIIRGAGGTDRAGSARAASRGGYGPADRGMLGFRPARTLP